MHVSCKIHVQHKVNLCKNCIFYLLCIQNNLHFYWSYVRTTSFLFVLIYSQQIRAIFLRSCWAESLWTCSFSSMHIQHYCILYTYFLFKLNTTLLDLMITMMICTYKKVTEVVVVVIVVMIKNMISIYISRSVARQDFFKLINIIILLPKLSLKI